MENKFIKLMHDSAQIILLNTKDKNKKVLIVNHGNDPEKLDTIICGLSIDKTAKALFIIFDDGKQQLLLDDLGLIAKAIFPKAEKYSVGNVITSDGLLKYDKDFAEVISDNNDLFFEQKFKPLSEKDTLKALDSFKIKHDDYTYNKKTVSNDTDFEPVKPLMGRENWEGKYDVIPEEIQKQLVSFPESIGMSFKSPVFKRIEEGFKSGTFRYLNIVGGTGAGKTQFLEYLCEKLGVPAFEVTFTRTLDTDYMFGQMQLKDKDTVFVPGYILKLISLPIVLVLQDVSRADALVLSILIGLFDNTPYFTAPDGTQWKKHPQFRVLMSSNPADENSEVTEFSKANLSRFRTYKIPYPTKEEQLERLQFHVGEKFTNVPFLEELIDVQNIISKELKLHGEDFVPDYRKLVEAIEDVVDGYQQDYYTKEFFQIDMESAFLGANANNNMTAYDEVVPVLRNRIDGLYAKFMAANGDFKDEVKPFVLTERVTATVQNIDDINFDEFTQNVSTTI